MQSYYTEEDFLLINQASSFKGLCVAALRVLSRMTGNIIQVCGPISTGGVGSVEGNIKKLQETIIGLSERGFVVFDQMPLEQKISELVLIWKKENPAEKYCHPILEDLYKPIFESGFIKELWFLPDWQSSHGAKWERLQAKRLNIKIVDIESLN
jgi:hypothetical protein